MHSIASSPWGIVVEVVVVVVAMVVVVVVVIVVASGLRVSSIMIGIVRTERRTGGLLGLGAYPPLELGRCFWALLGPFWCIILRLRLSLAWLIFPSI